jgi:hypothetical protein
MAEAHPHRPGRNEPCHCGSGQKYKHCCMAKDEEAERTARAEHAAAAPPPEAAEAEPPHPTPPPRATDQPWKRGAQTSQFQRRITTPRKTG